MNEWMCIQKNKLRDDYIDLECQIDGQWFVFSAFMDCVHNSIWKNIYMTIDVPRHFHETTPTMQYVRLTEEMNKKIRAVLEQFKLFIMEYPAYCLHFATRQIAFDEKDVMYYL